MLDSLRNAAGTWVAKALLVLLVLSFAVWGISGQITNGFNSNAVVQAGDTEVSVTEYRLAYDRELRLLSQRFGQRITREQAQALGLDQQVLSQLVAGAVLDEQAREMDLGLSKDRLAALTGEDPAFRGPDGRFDRRAFDYVLREVGMRPEDYLRNRQQVAVRQQIVEAVSDGLSVPDTFLKAAALYRGEDRTVEFIKLPGRLVEPIEPPDDTALQAYFEDNKADWRAPEYRKINLVVLEPESIADPDAISDEQVRADYEARKDRYTSAETRLIDQLVFKSRDEAEAARKRITGGATFDEVAASEGKTPEDTSLGTVERSAIPDATIAEAAFSLGQNQVSDVIDGAFGPVLLRVREINPSETRPLDAVAGEIRRELALAEADRILLDVHDSYEDARAGGSTMAEAARQLGLPMTTVDAVDRAGLGPDGQQVPGIPEQAELLAAAFETEAGVENPPLNHGRSGFVWYEVEGVTPARDRTLDEVRDAVVAAWTTRERTDRLAQKAGELEKRLESGTTLDEIARDLELEKQVKRGLKRGADDADIGKAGVNAAFSVKQGETGLVPGPSGQEQILFRVTEVFEPAGASAQSIPEAERRQLTGAFSDDLLEQLVADLRDKYAVTMDRNAIGRALSF